MTQLDAAASKLVRKKIFKSRGGSVSFSRRRKSMRSSKEKRASVELPSLCTCVMRTEKADAAGGGVVVDKEAVVEAK